MASYKPLPPPPGAATRGNPVRGPFVSTYMSNSNNHLRHQRPPQAAASADLDMPQLGATFVPSGSDDYFMPEVYAPSPQRITPQVPQNMQGDLERMELEAHEPGNRSATNNPTYNSYNSNKNNNTPNNPHNDAAAATTTASGSKTAYPQRQSSLSSGPGAGAPAAQNNPPRIGASYQTPKDGAMSARNSNVPSFSPFPKVKGDNIPPSDEEKEEILWNAREHVLHSNNVSMQLSWARDTLTWVEIVQDAAIREANGQPRPPTPKVEHTLKADATSIVEYLTSQDHPEALFMKSKWLEFGKFGVRQDKKEAYNGYVRAAALGFPRAEYRLGMLFESSNDHAAAVEHYYTGLRQQDSAASYRLGMMSLLGQHGQIKDYARGLNLIREAADSADEDAPQGAYVYGMLLSRELPEISIPESFLPIDPALSKMYLEKAAYLGFAKAQLKMGQAYELCQLGCDFNPAYSIHYYGLASKQGLPEAALGVSRWFLFGYEGIFAKNELLAFKYAEEAAVAKLPTAEFAMGYYHEIGIHVPKDVRLARNWYESAAEHGNKDALDRLESLSQSKTLTKSDHETTTLGRIKSVHGSQRGKRPDRFKQNQPMPTLDEAKQGRQPSPRVSPHPSPRVRPTVVQDTADFPEPSRASVQMARPAFGVNLDANLAIRPASAAPYPEDDRPLAANANYRPRSVAPYPEDDVARGRLGVRSTSGPHAGPHADRPGSAFGIRPPSQDGPGRGPYGGPIPASQSMGNLGLPGADPRGGYRQPSPGPGGYRQPAGQRPGSAHQPYPTGPSGPAGTPGLPVGGPAGKKLSKPGPGGYGRQQPGAPSSPQAGPGAYPPTPPVGPMQPGRDYGPRTSSRPTPPPGSRPDRYDAPPQKNPAAAGGPRLSSLHSTQTMPVSAPGPGSGPGPGLGPGSGPRPTSARPDLDAGRTNSAPPATHPKPSGGPPKPTKQASQGPATFEEMGIPQGKSDDQCVVM